MVLASQWQSINQLTIRLELFYDAIPHATCVSQLLHVSNHEKAFPGAGKSDTDTILRIKEANFPLNIAANKRHQYDIVFFALEVVDRRYTNSACKRFDQLLEEEHLPGVHC